MKKRNGYQIQHVAGRMNAMSEDQNQTYASLEEARDWADCVAEEIETYNAEIDPDITPPLRKEDYVIAYYVDGVERGEFPLFVK